MVSLASLTYVLLPGVALLASTSSIDSTFDTSDEGWRVIGDVQSGSSTPSYVAIGGNPGGYISAKDDVLGGTWYWQAPATFLGNQSTNYQRNLHFELTQSDLSQPFEDKDIMLSGNGLMLTYNTAYNPTTTWTPYNVILSEVGWTNNATGKPATAIEMQTVLQSVTMFRIRGEYRDGPDTGGLDNVVLGGPPLSVPIFLPTITK